MLKNLIFLTGAAILSSTTFAQTWCHEAHESSDGSLIELHYQVESYNSRFMGMITHRKNSWLHVSNPALKGDEHVRFVLLNIKQRDNGSWVEEAANYQADANYDPASRRFTATANQFFVPIKYQFGSEYHQEIAVSINGRWLKIPGTDTSNLSFTAQNYGEYCANPY